MKANNVCTLEPARVARILVDYDPADTVRFYALRLREAWMIRATPQRVLADGTDWRSLNELKNELKG